MPNSKRTRVQSKKKRRFLMTSKKSWVIEDRLVPLYSNLIDCYSNQLPEDPFCCEIIQVKQESQEDFLLESLPSVDEHNSSNHFKEVIRCFILLFSHLEFALEESKQWLRYCKTKQTCFFKRF